jgi:hypothetical protein
MVLPGRLERVKGIEPSYSAWKSPDSSCDYNAHSDNSSKTGRLKSQEHFSQSECPPHSTNALRNFASEAANTIYNLIDQAASADQLERYARLLWRGSGEGEISDGDAQFLHSYIDSRRPPSIRTAPGFHKSISAISGRLASRFTSRQRQQSPDRKASRDRRRMLGASGVMPATLSGSYTEGQRAVFCIVAGEIKCHGVCDLPIDKIAALAGVGRTTVQTAMHEARRLGHITITERPRRGCKSLTNLVRISSAEWLAWVRRAPSAARFIGSNPLNLMSSTKIKIRKRHSKEVRVNRSAANPAMSTLWDHRSSVMRRGTPDHGERGRQLGQEPRLRAA